MQVFANTLKGAIQMNLARFLWKEHRTRAFLTIVFSLLHTGLNILILGWIGMYTSQMREPPFKWWVFFLLISGAVAAQTIAVLSIDRMSYETLSSLRERLVTKTMSSSLAALERIGKSRITTAFIDDIQRVSTSVRTCVGMARDLTFVLGIFAYLLWLSPKMMGAVAIVLAISASVFCWMRTRALRFAAFHTAMNDRAIRVFGDALEGIKQTKTSEYLETEVIRSIGASICEAERSGIRMGQSFTAGVQPSVLLYFIALLMLTYMRIDGEAGAGVVAVYVLGLLLVLNPLIGVAFSVEQISVARIYLSRIDALMSEIDVERQVIMGEREGRTVGDAMVSPVSTHAQAEIQIMELRNLSHRYQLGSRQEFALGPINLKVRAGECVFVIGGNGTGKTTLVKLLTGLYIPAGGEISINDVVIDDAKRRWLARQFSVVFNDLCLFESLANSEYDETLTSKGASLLTELHLDHAVVEGRTLLSQAASCSSGERRRIAMLLARLEDRSIYVFDEFAADQDPGCKDLFYNHLIDDLRRRGKIVFVITHDERYFNRADHILVLERGVAPRLRHNDSARLGSVVTAS